MQAANFEFSHLATTMYDQLPPKDQADIVKSLELLNGASPGKWPAKRVLAVPNAPGHYILRANKKWRAFLHVEEGRPPQVRDILSQEHIDLVASRKR